MFINQISTCFFKSCQGNRVCVLVHNHISLTTWLVFMCVTPFCWTPLAIANRNPDCPGHSARNRPLDPQPPYWVLFPLLLIGTFYQNYVLEVSVSWFLTNVTITTVGSDIGKKLDTHHEYKDGTTAPEQWEIISSLSKQKPSKHSYNHPVLEMRTSCVLKYVVRDVLVLNIVEQQHWKQMCTM